MAIRAEEAPIAIESARQLELFDEPPAAPQRAQADLIVLNQKPRRSAPVGREVAHFIRWFRNEFGATSETLRDYEAILAKLALEHADLELADFEPPEGTTRLREFIDERWGDAAPRTRKKVRAVLMSFFKWAQAEFKLHGNRSFLSARRASATSSASFSRRRTSFASLRLSRSCAIASH